MVCPVSEGCLGGNNAHGSIDMIKGSRQIDRFYLAIVKVRARAACSSRRTCFDISNAVTVRLAVVEEGHGIV